MNTRFFTKFATAWKSARILMPFSSRILGKIRLTNAMRTNSTRKIRHYYSHSQEHIIQQQKWLDSLTKETTAHCAYLSSTGLADRANYFKVKSFIYQESDISIDISRFSHPIKMPEIVDKFNPQEKNTLFAHPESSADDQQHALNRTLDIRLYPPIRQLIKKQGVTIFLGSKNELQAYTESLKEKLIIEIEVPSSVKFYIALDTLGDIKIYLSNLVSHENLIQQLITLKLAGIDVRNVPILGDTEQYKKSCRKDLAEFENQSSSYLMKRNVLVVAGCSLEDMACSTLEQVFSGKMSKKKFSGDIVSLTYIKSENVPNLGFIVLNLNYGEICEEQIAIILEKFNCIGIFSGSAAGYIPKNINDELPKIGDRVAVQAAKHHSGELVTLENKSENLHLHVPTIFVETFDWLGKSKALGGTTVDVETFYILRAVKKYQEANPHKKLQTDVGVFISDYVGKKPLRSYENVFAQYPLELQKFVSQVLVTNITSVYNSNRLSTPTFKQEYFSIEPKPIAIEQSMKKEPVIDSIGKHWNKSEFKRVHTPVTIGTVDDKGRFSNQTAPRCLHLPIKLPGSNIRIPDEYQHFSKILQRILDFEISINSNNWDSLYAYLTVDQGFVPQSNSQRVPGPHVDGIPRDRNNPEKQLVDHAYLVTDEIPTMFYMQKFDMTPYDPNIHHFFAIFRALSDESRTITVKPFEIVLMNAFSVHTPTQTLKDVNRTFIRLEFSTLKFDRVGNSINPHFVFDNKFTDYPFQYIPRPIPANLFLPPDVYLNKPITNKDYSHESLEHFGRANLRAIFTENERVKLKDSDYKNLDFIALEIMKSDTHGIVISHHGIPHAFCLYKMEDKKVKLDVIFTLKEGKDQEIMIYGMKILKKLSDKLSLQAGLKEDSIPISIVIHENNNNMLGYFLRAARLAKVAINIERGISNMFSSSNSFKTHLDSLSESSKELLSHYGSWAQTTEQRQALSITGIDEYLAIRQSLYVMAIFLKHDSLEDISKALKTGYQEEGFEFSGIKVESKDEKSFAENITNILKLRNNFREKYLSNSNELLLEAFIIHDLGKQRSFIRSESKSAASNEKYLKDWLDQKQNIERKDRYQTAGKLIDIFDGLGYNPAKLVSNGYTGLLTTVENTLDYLRALNNANVDTLGNNIESFNHYLFLKAKSLGLDKQFNFDFLIENNSKRKPWTQLTDEQQNNVVMLVLCCPFIFIKPPLTTQKVTEEFITQWNNKRNTSFVNEIRQFIIDNMFSKDPVWLYNITGLLHHTSAQSGSHFANGGTVEELFSSFFPFVINTAKGKTTSISIEPVAERTFNKFQMLQGMEVMPMMPQHMLENKSLPMRAVNFADPNVKAIYLENLRKAKAEIEAKASSTAHQNEQKNHIEYIVDTDIGGDIDDTLALFVALNSDVKPLAITTTHIAPEEKAKIAKLIASECGYPGLPVYSGIGCTRKDTKEKFMQQNPLFPAKYGFPNPANGEKKWHEKQAIAYREAYGTSFDKMKIEKESAAEFIAKTAKKYSPENKLTIVALGPLHNIDEALKIDPSIANNIKLVTMGGLHPKGYNWLISPEVTARVLSKVEAQVITSEFIGKNGFFITPDELEKIIEKTQSPFGKTVVKDWKNWHKADHFGKTQTNLYDPITVYLALHPSEITSINCQEVSFPCLQSGKLQSKFINRPYFDPDLKGEIISAKESKDGNTRFVTQVKSPSSIRENVISMISNRLTSIPPKSVRQSPTFFNKKVGLFVGIAALGVGLFARGICNQPSAGNGSGLVRPTPNSRL